MNVEKLTVERITESTSNGMWSAMMSDGNWYGCGRYAPKFAEGDYLEFGYTMNGKYRNMDFKHRTVLTEEAPAGGAAPVSNKDKARQDSIVYQAALKCAVPAAVGAVQAEIVSMPAKQADKLEAYLLLVEEIAARFASTARYADIEKVEENDQDNS